MNREMIRKSLKRSFQITSSFDLYLFVNITFDFRMSNTFNVMFLRRGLKVKNCFHRQMYLSIRSSNNFADVTKNHFLRNHEFRSFDLPPQILHLLHCILDSFVDVGNNCDFNLSIKGQQKCIVSSIDLMFI